MPYGYSPAKLTPVGEWAADGVYAAGEVVTRNGSAYWAKTTPTVGNDPEANSPDQWQLIAAKGAKGDRGDIAWRGAWAGSTEYAADDAVSSGGAAYIATATSTDVEPGVTEGWESYWDLLAQGEKGADGVNGSVWSNGSGAPDNGTGVDGDYYLDTSNNDVYQKVSGEWSLITNIGVGVAMGSIVVATPSDHATVEVLGDTFELVADTDSPAEGNVGVQWGVFQAGAQATGRLIVASEPTGAAGLLHVGNSSYKYYALAATDPEYVDYYWIEWPSGTPYTSAEGAAAIALAINTNDSAAYSATAGGPDENGCYYVDITAVEEGSEWDATAYITSSDLSGGDITGGGFEGTIPDSDAVVALALATAIGNEGQVRTAIDPAGPAEVILIAKVSGLVGKAVITTTGTGLTATNMT